MAAPPKSFDFVLVASDRKQTSLPTGSFRRRFGSMLGPFRVQLAVVKLDRVPIRLGSAAKSVPSRLIIKLNIFAEGFSYGINHFGVALASL